MEVAMRPVGSVKPYDNNPRDNDSAVDAVAASLRAYGWRQPLVVDEQDVIIVGHTRYKAAIKLGMAEVPVHVARVQQARAEMVKRSAGMLTAAAGESVRTLLALQKDTAPPAVRLGAARAVLELGVKVRELVDLEARIAALEGQAGLLGG